MAEKKFCGAPFGTQTARFDVTGVHPKNKTPGTFTQIPYDKHSMIEQDNWCHSAVTQSMSMKKIYKFDQQLRNIRFCLKNIQKQMKEINSIKKCKSSTKIERKNNRMNELFSRKNNFQTTKLNGNNDFQHQKLSAVNQYLGIVQDQEPRVYARKDICKKIIWDKNKNSLHNHKYDYSLSSGNLNHNSTVEVNVVDESKDGEKREVRSSNLDLDHETVLVEESEKIALPEESKEVSEEMRKSSVIDDKMIVSEIVVVSVPEEQPQKKSIETPSVQLTIEVSTNSEATNLEKAEYANIDPYDLPKIMKGVENKSNECVVPRNSKVPDPTSVKTKKKKMISCDEFLKRKLGPGVYNTVVGGFSPSRVEQRASGPGWARQLEVERLAALPHLLYKEQWEENKMLKRKLGPGSYQIKDFIQTTDLKPRSNRGICENLAPRFEKGVTNFTPGPGTYGMGGVPQRAIEEKGQQATSTKGLLDSGDRKRNLPSVGSHLGPGTYKHKTCTEEMLNKVTSLRGPYELYSGDRNKPISEGYLAAPKLADLGPGQYEIGSFVDDLYSAHRKSHGAFGKMVQYPDVATERIFLFSQAHYSKNKDFPGPGAYSMQEVSKSHAVSSPGFLSSAKRDDKLSQKFFTRNFNPVGPGRYDIQKFAEAQDSNGHSSVFKSKTGKPGLQMAKFLQERVRGKDVPLADRMCITDPEKPALSRAVTVL